MWFYELGQQAVGPVESDAIDALLRAGTIRSTTLVWREGMPDWKPLDETDLAVLLLDIPPLPVQPVPPPLPRSNYPRVSLHGLKAIFNWWLGLQATGVVIVLAIVISAFVYVPQLMSLTSMSDETATLLMFISIGVYFTMVALIIAIAVLLYILHYRLWQVVQDGQASTTPGMAIGLLFVPYFNFYWIFRAQYGLAKDLNSYVTRHFTNTQANTPRKAHPALSLISILSSFAGPLIYMTFFMLFMPKAGDSAALAQGQIQSFFVPLGILVAVIITVMFITNLLTFLDFYLSARSILEAEEKR